MLPRMFCNVWAGKLLNPRLYLVLLWSNKNELCCLWLHKGKGSCYEDMETSLVS